MRKLICYARTIKEWKAFLHAWLFLDAIYVAHDYKEVFHGFVKSRNRVEQKLVCQTCGDVSISYY